MNDTRSLSRKFFVLRHLFFFLFILFPVLDTAAQSARTFPTDTAGFAESFRAFMIQTHLTPTQLAELDEFIRRVSSDSATVTPEKRERVLHTLNRLRSRRGRQVPFFTDYISTFLILEDRYPDPSYFDAWEKGLLTLLDDRKVMLRSLQKFLSSVKNFLEKRELYTTRAMVWRTDSVPFRFVYDSLFFIVPDRTPLVCMTVNHDSIVIEEAEGKYDPYRAVWHGRRGKVTWERAGYSPDSVFALLEDYRLNLTRNGYQLDSVRFMNRSYFPEPILGSLEDKVSHITRPSAASYPRFRSYVNRFRIPDLYPGVHYEGGFSMQGAVVNGTGSSFQRASVSFFRGDTLRLVVRSVFFAIHKDHIASRECSATFYLDNDSIYHPNIAFSYNVPVQEVSLYQTDNLMTTSPYFDSYHRLNIAANRFVWLIDENKVLFTRLRGTTIGEARFWSTNFFNDQTYYKIQYLDQQHPLYLLKRFADYFLSDEFPVEDLAYWMKKPEYQVRRMIVNMAVLGFVFYNPETGEVKIKKELYDYLDAHAKKIDYDVMSFFSRTRAPVDNAILDLATNDMTINGVPTIFLSDSQNVAIYPAGNRIIMHKNRSFSFDGQVKAGMSTLYGKKFIFSYDSFKIQLNKIDSMKFMAYGDKVDDLGNPVPERINNILEIVTGDVYIDKPDNKSGRKRYAEYPFFRSTDTAYVFYDEASVYDTIYNRKDFYFVIEPFTLYRLNELRKEDLVFKGDFISGSIFPAIPQELKVQEDNSLGFVSSIPDDGIPVYDGKGRYFNKVRLSNQGLNGAGKLTYLSATIRSDRFTFFPDSMLTRAHDVVIDTFAVKGGVRFPHIQAQDVNIRWYPHRDEMHILRRSEDPVLYTSYPLRGDLLLTPTALYADGRITLPGLHMTSRLFRLDEYRMSSDTAHLVVTGPSEGKKTLLEAPSVSATIDVAGHAAMYESLEDTLPVTLPGIRWITSLDHLLVDYDRQTIILTNSRTSDDQYLLFLDPLRLQEHWEKIPTFISLHPKMDTLGFASDSSVYDLTKNRLTAYHVAPIEVADARVYPDSARVAIRSTGFLAPLENAVLEANGLHTLDSVSLTIFARNDFSGTGNYHYRQNNGVTETVHFDRLFVDDSLRTHGWAHLKPEEGFMLSPAFAFAGKVELRSHRPLLTFSGGAKIQHDCPAVKSEYVSFKCPVNPDSIYLPIPAHPVDIHHKKLYAGHMITNDSIRIYPAFFSYRQHYSDQLVSHAEGVLHYDAASGEYRLGSPEKVRDPSLPGNYLTLNKNFCRLKGEGQLNLGVDLGQVQIVTVGDILQDMEGDSVVLDVMIGLDFFFHPEALQIMHQEIDSLTRLPAVDVHDEHYQRLLKELPIVEHTPSASSERGKKKKEVGIPSILQLQQVPPAQRHTIFLSKVHLRWDPETRSFISEGKIGLGNINGRPLNVLVDGYLEIRRRRSGSAFDLYLQPTSRIFYYFAYTPGVMQAIARNRAFMAAIMQEKESKRMVRTNRTGPSYIYMPGVNRKMTMFLQRMELFKEPVRENEGN